MQPWKIKNVIRKFLEGKMDEWKARRVIGHDVFESNMWRMCNPLARRSDCVYVYRRIGD